MKVLALDIGGTSVKSSLLEREGESARIVHRFPIVKIAQSTVSELQRAVFQAISEASSFTAVTAIGIATTGAVNKDGLLVSALFFRSAEHISWFDAIRDKYRNIRTVRVLNDGNAATWGEFSVRTNKDISESIHFVAGTGIGGGIISQGRLFVGTQGFAGEMGKIIVDPGMSTDQPFTGVPGSVEIFASRQGILRYVNSRLNETNTRLKSADELDIPVIAKYAMEGDELALAAFIQAGKYLGVAIATACNMLNPQMVTIGGGIVDAAPRTSDGQSVYVSAAQDTCFKFITPRIRELVSISEGLLGNDAGMIGAGLAAMEH